MVVALGTTLYPPHQQQRTLYDVVEEVCEKRSLNELKGSMMLLLYRRRCQTLYRHLKRTSVNVIQRRRQQPFNLLLLLLIVVVVVATVSVLYCCWMRGICIITYTSRHHHQVSTDGMSSSSSRKSALLFLQQEQDNVGSIISNSIQWRHYTIKDIAQCFDQGLKRRRRRRGHQDDDDQQQQQRPYHIAFIGESIPRFQYSSFIEVFPDYDRVIAVEPHDGVIKMSKHTDRNETSRLLNVIVSFRWRPLIDDKFIATLRQWNTPPYSSTPDLIVMGTYTVYNC